MSFLALDAPAVGGMFLSLSAHLAAGIVLGVVYFHGLWWNARLFALGGRATTAVSLMIGRFTLLGGLLALASLGGALPLLMITLGVLVARSAVMRKVRRTAP